MSYISTKFWKTLDDVLHPPGLYQWKVTFFPKMSRHCPKICLTLVCFRRTSLEIFYPNDSWVFDHIRLLGRRNSEGDWGNCFPPGQLKLNSERRFHWQKPRALKHRFNTQKLMSGPSVFQCENATSNTLKTGSDLPTSLLNKKAKFPTSPFKLKMIENKPMNTFLS